MSDDLVERLRDTSHGVRLAREAADRIEELEAKLATCEKYRDAYAECDRIGTQAVRDLEAKLARAVKTLAKIGKTYTADKSRLIHGDLRIIEMVQTALEELKGEDRG